ncbi:MAG: hypothetical protein WDO17_28720 [Alphaproteobacteria bacterium]
MRKTVALILAAAFVAALPSMASAKKAKHVKHHRGTMQQPASDGSFIGAALHQIIVPFEVTFGPRTY